MIETPLRVLLVDDDPVVLGLLEKVCLQLDQVDVVGTALSAEIALSEYGDKAIEVLITDVNMPDMNGLALARNFVARPYVIFTSSDWETAVDAFAHQATDFVPKPIRLDRLRQAIGRVRQDLSRKQRVLAPAPQLFIRSNRKLIRLDLDATYYLESMGDYVAFYTAIGRHLVHSPLKEIEAHIEHPDWLRVHRSFLVNLAHVVDIEDNTLVIGDRVIPISRNNRPRLMTRIKTLG